MSITEQVSRVTRPRLLVVADLDAVDAARVGFARFWPAPDG